MTAFHTSIISAHRDFPTQRDKFGVSSAIPLLNQGRILSMRAIKPVSMCVLFGLALVLMSGNVVSVSAQEVKFAAKEPALLTTAGQSADLNMAKVLLDRNKVALKVAPLAGADDLKDVGSLIIVIGGSTKGLGAAGINTDKEMARVEQLIARAAAQKIPIIGMHIGGKARRGELSDKFVELVTPKSSFLLVVKEGDSDGYFSKVMADKKIGGRIVDKLGDLQEPIKTIYGK
jgi:hypothetical protein